MKIYVDEMPKSCGDCVFCKQTEYCYYCDKLHMKLGYIDKGKDCPLQPLADYTKQVRKEVLADLKEKYKKKMANALCDDAEIGHINCDAVLGELLEEIGFDEVLELYRSQGKWYT